MNAIIAPLKITTPNKRYAPVGRCIYCRAFSNKLTKEHIIAHGLAGDALILPKASCLTCQERTRDAENACLRHLWWPFRTRIGAPSSGKQPPKEFLVRRMTVTGFDGVNVTGYDKNAELKVGPMEFPFTFLTYKFLPPGISVGRDIEADGQTEIVLKYNADEVQKFASKDKQGFRIAPMDLDSYCRMLSKVAHAYAVAELGLDSFIPSLTGFIRGGIVKSWYWIGSEDPTPPTTPSFHDIRWVIEKVGEKNYVVVELRLFSLMGSPKYRIVVGELCRPLDQLPTLEQTLHCIDVETSIPIPEFVTLDHSTGEASA